MAIGFFEFQTTGLKELGLILKLGPTRLRRETKESIREITNRMRTTARRKVYEVAEQITGTAKRGIRTSVLERSRVVEGRVRATRGFFYWRFLEHGTRFTKSDFPFIGPTIEEEEDDAARTMSTSVRKAYRV